VTSDGMISVLTYFWDDSTLFYFQWSTTRRCLQFDR